MTFLSRSVAGLDSRCIAAARSRQSNLTKPAGSLGAIEALAVQLCGIWRTEVPRLSAPHALIFAADHPVAALGVSAYPAAVTAAMVRNFATGGAAANALAAASNAHLCVIDVGVSVAYQGEVAPGVSVQRSAVADSECGNMADDDALTIAGFDRALAAGAQAIESLPAECNTVVLGEMGIGNTTCAAAIAGALLGVAASEVTGAGTGVHGEVLANKIRVVDKAIARCRGDNPAEILRKCGGRELVAIVGAAQAAIARNLAIVVDGFIVTAALACLAKADPRVQDYFVFAHRSAERGHTALLKLLDAKPLLDLQLRLGEGSGGLLALPLLHACCAVHNQMATFAEAAVPNRDGQ